MSHCTSNLAEQKLSTSEKSCWYSFNLADCAITKWFSHNPVVSCYSGLFKLRLQAATKIFDRCDAYVSSDVFS